MVVALLVKGWIPEKFLLVTVAVTVSRRTPAMMVSQTGTPGCSEGVKKMVESTGLLHRSNEPLA
jgi:hypothetical protein